MEKKAVKFIIFDLGKVLIDFDHKIAAKRAALFCDKPPEEIFDYFFNCRSTVLFEEGKISPSEFFQKMKKALNLRLAYKEFLPIWNEIFFFTEKNRAVYNLSKELRNHYKVALLSNINTLHFDYCKKNFPIFDVFHNLFLSFKLKLTKPDPLIYKKVLKILKALPEEVFYTDDRPELIEESRRLGIKGFVFNDPEKLKKDLRDYGVISTDAFSLNEN